MKEERYVRVINEALREEMARDKKVFIFGEDVGYGGGAFAATRGLLDEFGQERVIDTPISEQAIMGMALGAAIAGLRPIVEIMFSDFLALCGDQVVNQIAKTRFMSGGQFVVPLTIRTTSGVGGYAGPQHSQCLEAWFAHIPGLKVVMPSTAYDAKGLLKSSIRDNNPVIFIETRSLYAMKIQIPEEEYLIPLGKADIKREGSDVTVIALARMVFEALKAAEELTNEGISAEVVDPRTISPFDKETVMNSVKKTGKVVIAHEAVKIGGIGAEISATIMEEALNFLEAPVMRVGAPFGPAPYSKPLEDSYPPSSDDIITAVKQVLAW
jgi:pyruvate dehydrogenase E1 component beta subunit